MIGIGYMGNLIIWDSLREQQEKLQAERLALIRENRKAQEKLDRFDKLLDDFVQVSVVL